MDEIKKKIITIGKEEAIKKKDDGSMIGLNIFEEVNGKEVKYALWFTKQDKTSTKAYLQYKTQGLRIGSSVGIAYKEVPNQFEYTDKKTKEKKTAQSTNRTIVWFSEPSEIEEYDDKKSFISTPEELPILEQEKEEIDVSKIPF